ncbi:hypothetical protein GHK92_14315 [Nocardioides sp. dk4132]|uniref:hypothetical protein n=1 Tax=unclassified Nocardioides TaxID=2615069 RepID=UPI0012978BE4|nr:MULTISPECIES: hypothetical protein [unclassified Nocardioides]MQW77053.1 hypothetical protein [Nocardioides sp. dk4132]QGA09458.1 hypothetical protein GFH29_20220 [Nocardioides sp. dk884]
MTRPDDDQDAQVRRLLREARHDEPVPDDVATRLERVLAQLAADDPADVPDPDEVAARRRRRAGGLLVAAAAVVVAGVAIGQVVDPGDSASSDSDATSAQDTSADEATSAPSEGAVRSTLPRRQAPSPTGDPVEVQADHFTRDARALLRATEGKAAYSAGSGGAGAADSDDRVERYRDRAPAPHAQSGPTDELSAAARGNAWFSCDPAPWGPGRLVAVRYDGEPAVVAVRPAAGDTRVVEVLQCGTGAILRSVTLPRR